MEGGYSQNSWGFYTSFFIYCSTPTSYEWITAIVTCWQDCISIILIIFKWARVENSLFFIVIILLLNCCFVSCFQKFSISIALVVVDSEVSLQWWAYCFQKVTVVFLPTHLCVCISLFIQWRKLMPDLFWLTSLMICLVWMCIFYCLIFQYMILFKSHHLITIFIFLYSEEFFDLM